MQHQQNTIVLVHITMCVLKLNMISDIPYIDETSTALFEEFFYYETNQVNSIRSSELDQKVYFKFI